MKKGLLIKCMYLVPIAVLCVMLFLLNYTLQHFRDTAYDFVYNTNTDSVKMFSQELSALGNQGYPSQDEAYRDIYTRLILNYNITMGEKESIVTFMMDETGQIHHSTSFDELYLAEVLADANNQVLIAAATESQGNGEVMLRNGGREETMYYHRFYSGEDDYTLFMTVDRETIEAQLNVNEIVLPISAIGLLLLVMSELLIWHKLEDIHFEEMKAKEKASEAGVMDGD